MVRVLIVQSGLDVGDWVERAFPRDRFLLGFGIDALTVVATASAQEIDLVVLDTPLSDLDVRSLLDRLHADRLRIAVVVLGDPPPGEPDRVGFPLRFVRKPLDAREMDAAVESVLREAEERRSIPPLAPPSAAPPQRVDAVPTIPPAAGFEQVVAAERAILTAAEDAPADRAIRTAVIVDGEAASAARLAALVEGVGATVRILTWRDCDTLEPLRLQPPDVLLVGVESAAEAERFVRDIRLDARLRNAPLAVVSSSLAVLDAVRMLPPPAIEVLRRDAPDQEVTARIGSMLAPLEQTRERIAAEKVASGEIAPVGAIGVLRLAAEVRGTARVVLRGDGRLAEIDLTDGAISAIAVTEPDGRHRTDVDALVPIVAMRSGRYSVRPPPLAGSSGGMRLPVPDVLWQVADRMTDLLVCTTPVRIARVERVRFHDSAGVVRGLSPAESRGRARLQEGAPPRAVSGMSGMSLEAVAKLVQKLVLAGEVAAVEGPHLTRKPVEEEPAPPPPPPAARPAVRIRVVPPGGALPPPPDARPTVPPHEVGAAAATAERTITLEEALSLDRVLIREGEQTAAPAGRPRTDLSAVSALLAEAAGARPDRATPISVPPPPLDAEPEAHLPPPAARPAAAAPAAPARPAPAEAAVSATKP
ncbi:MAG: hypothetical protein QME96_06785, partial [Myxococcota bacterium]|nr:hypothetical protein [Myxococcota bacterium]